MNTLVLWNSRGLIPGPEESEENYFLRCRKAVTVMETAPPPNVAEKLFDIRPDWISILYDDRRLHFWEGGCTWIEPQKTVVQLHKSFQTRERYLGIYKRDEIIAHEMVHVVRSYFEEPIFEEILAYQTSSSRLQRYLGPIFRSSHESTLFMTGLSLFVVVAFFASNRLIPFLGLFGLVGIFLGRLFRCQRIFSKTKKNLEALLGTAKSLPILIRLTDREIIRFSTMKCEEIQKFAQKMQKTQIRWKQIVETYFQQGTTL